MKQTQNEKIYNDEYVMDLFNKMSASYERMNFITSFGFSHRWRHQCVEKLQIDEKDKVIDLLTGMGENWPFILKENGPSGELTGLDFSKKMLEFAKRRKEKYKHRKIEILLENVLDNDIEGDSFDVVVSSFGMKTFSEEKLKKLASEIKRILKEGGRFSLIDVSVPSNRVLRFFYMFYLKNVIPFLGKVFLGNPDDYRMLGVYTEKFGNAEKIYEVFKSEGLEVRYDHYFFGCASGVSGAKYS